MFLLNPVMGPKETQSAKFNFLNLSTIAQSLHYVASDVLFLSPSYGLFTSECDLSLAISRYDAVCYLKLISL